MAGKPRDFLAESVQAVVQRVEVLHAAAGG
jgi:hypothetical protein